MHTLGSFRFGHLTRRLGARTRRFLWCCCRGFRLAHAGFPVAFLWQAWSRREMLRWIRLAGGVPFWVFLTLRQTAVPSFGGRISARVLSDHRCPPSKQRRTKALPQCVRKVSRRSLPTDVDAPITYGTVRRSAVRMCTGRPGGEEHGSGQGMDSPNLSDPGGSTTAN